MVPAEIIALAACLVAVGLSDVRFLRVAQREHYVTGEALRFAWRWWGSGADNEALIALGVAAAVASAFFPPLALLTAGAMGAGPRRLSLRGRTSRLVWTRRLVTTAVVAGILEAAGVSIGAAIGGLRPAVVVAAVVSILAPVGIDLALVVTRPIENSLAERFVAEAKTRLEKVRPLVIGITGSYGKTTVKGYVAHLLSPYRTTLASPKSFNNRAGLARTVNEMLGPATEIFVAEMGTYGPGEIAGLCSWLAPEISVMTAIGPAHLQRFKSLDVTLAAKSEITVTARTVVLNVDDERLAGFAKVLASSGKEVIGASGVSDVADVAVIGGDDGLELSVGGRRIGTVSVPPGDQPTSLSNAACAAAVAMTLGIPPEEVLTRLASLPVPPNRLQRYVSGDGYVVFDDTFNSNPKGARMGLKRLQQEQVSASGRRVMVTPGMVELGATQRRENAELAKAAAGIVDVLVVVARTNRRALLEGASRAGTSTQVLTVDRLDQALEWVRGHLGPGDAVLYENDLPDHYP